MASDGGACSPPVLGLDSPPVDAALGRDAAANPCDDEGMERNQAGTKSYQMTLIGGNNMADSMLALATGPSTTQDKAATEAWG
jgi:hypothetical protein